MDKGFRERKRERRWERAFGMCVLLNICYVHIQKIKEYYIREFV
jgi:hypothetical protein